MRKSAGSKLVHPFCSGDRFELPVPGLEYHPDHPLMRQISDACPKGEFDEFKRLYPLGTLEPLWYQAIREDRADVVEFLFGQGIKMCRLGVWDAVTYKCSVPMWQVFLDHGLDINESNDDACPPPLAQVLYDETLIQWFLAHGADPNAESPFGLSPMLRALRRHLCQQSGSFTLQADLFLSQFRLYARLVGRPTIKAMVDANSLCCASYSTKAPIRMPKSGHTTVAAMPVLLRRGVRTDVKTFNIASRGKTALELAEKYAPGLLPLVKECRMREMETQETRNKSG